MKHTDEKRGKGGKEGGEGGSKERSRETETGGQMYTSNIDKAKKKKKGIIIF